MMRLPRWTTICVLGLCGCSTTAPYQQNRAPTPAPLPTPVTPQDPGPVYAPGVGGNSSTTPGPVLGVPESFRELDGTPIRSAGVAAPRPRYNAYRGGVDATNVATGRATIAWSARDKSTRGRPIESITLGDGTRRVAIIGSLHGNEPQSIEIIDSWTQYLLEHPEVVSGHTILVIRNPNPDGSAAQSIFNEVGVDLNRNFPSSNWTLLPQNRSGPRVASEVETRVVMQRLEDFHPELLVHVKDFRGRSLINAEGNAFERAVAIARESDFKDAHDLGKATSGSLEYYGATRLKCACLTLLINREASGAAAWKLNRKALLATLADDSLPDKRAENDDRTRDPFTNSVGFHGRGLDEDEELPLLPGKSVPLNRRSPIPETGYFELPPSP